MLTKNFFSWWAVVEVEEEETPEEGAAAEAEPEAETK